MSFRTSVEKYLKAIAAVARQGDAREESYYGALRDLFAELGPEVGNAHTMLTVLPRATEAGNPDMRVWSDKQHVTGYMECKKPEETELDRVEVGDQLRRYRTAFSNVILTNFLEFRLYRSGELMGQPVVIGSLPVLQQGLRVPFQHEEQFQELIERFFGFQLPRTYTAQTLAVALADRTRYLQRQVLAQLIDDENNRQNSDLVSLMREFKQVLITDLTSDAFADLYAQTITYGLFAARTRATGPFRREAAFDNIPGSIGILRKLFRYISGGDTPERLSVIIDDIADVLAVADISTVFEGYGRNGRDPVADFYETFLGEYDPAKKKQHGVYYTPQPVVTYIVRSIDQILRDTFSKADGLADPSVTVLDPAAGTMTFPATAVRLAAETYKAKYGDGSLSGWMKDHVLQHFYAFELMMAPYAIGHLRMSALFAGLGCPMGPDDRFKLYLTNTLDVSTTEQSPIPGLSPLAEESRLAEAVKVERPVLVIMGNPPYSGTSSNKGKWIKGLVDDYKQVDGRPLGEKNPKWLQDDYVKFIRFAQWKIDRAGEGILGFITNHSYLDNPTFRGMRQSLMTSFDQIHILDLHGNSKKKEKAPDGGRDENVFDIQQGVAILLAVKKRGLEKGVWHADLWGTREAKYQALGSGRMDQTAWQQLTPRSDGYLLVPQDGTLAAEYEQWPRVTDIFPVSSVGIVTARDELTIKFTPDQVWQTVNRFISMPAEEAREVFHLGKDARDWKVQLAQDDVRRSGPSQDRVVPILYRPFDIRYTYYTGHSRGFQCMPRAEVMRNMVSGNLGLCTMRQVSLDGNYSHALVISSIVNNRAFTSSKGIIELFPLYCQDRPASENASMFGRGIASSRHRHVNLNVDVVTGVAHGLGWTLVADGHGDLAQGLIGPEEILAYVYAVLYSPTYRTRYAESLKSDFPRIPFTRDRDTFLKLAGLGQQLIDLHLMRSPELDNPISRFCGKGDSAVEKVEYDADRGRITINPTQYFDGVTPDLWSYQVGGYQVLNKWLKDRKGSFLTSADTVHYSRVVTALARTIAVQESIAVFGVEDYTGIARTERI